MTIKRIESSPVTPIFCSTVEYNGIVYVRGVTAEDKSEDIKGQTQSVVDKIDGMLAAAGTDKSKVLTATIYLSDLRMKPQMNDVWTAWTGPVNKPIRACVESGLELETLVEIVVTAAK
jgi:2-iminobutanoate/2-iminopropanoate deaminase